MEEIEVPIEHVQEQIHEHAHGSGEKWVMGVALTAAVLAALAAVASLLAGHHANEAMIEQLQASDQWSYYQAKGIKKAILDTKIELLQGMKKTSKENVLDKSKDYAKEQAEIKEKAEEKQKSSQDHLVRHVILARSVTMFQVAIAVAAISLLTKRKPFWYMSMLFGATGIVFLLQEFFAG